MLLLGVYGRHGASFLKPHNCVLHSVATIVWYCGLRWRPQKSIIK